MLLNAGTVFIRVDSVYERSQSPHASLSIPVEGTYHRTAAMQPQNPFLLAAMQ